MADRDKERPFDLGFFSASGREAGLAAADIIAIALTLLWLAVSGAVLFFLGRGAPGEGPDPLRVILGLLAMGMPVALIWVAAMAARSARVLRQEAARLQAAVDVLRQSHIQQQQGARMDVRRGGATPAAEPAAARPSAEKAVATFATTRGRAAPSAASGRGGAAAQPSIAGDQPSLALMPPAGEEPTPPLEARDFIRALNFPENMEDREGFRALRRAMEDRQASRLVRSAQDVLTLLSQEGIYMDDLEPDRARPEIWRKFAQGERGPAVAALGGVRDRSCLALTAARMKQDPIFRDVAHHFLRQFDRVLTEFEQVASDQEMNDLAETRTSRAFMLLGRVTGMFG
jgi:hypothetical protein